MSRINENFDSSVWGKIDRFVNGTEPETKETANEEIVRSRGKASFVGIEDTENLEFHDELALRQKEEDEKAIAKLREAENRSTGRFYKLWNRAYNVLAVLAALVIMALLVATVSYMPRFGEADNPVNNEVAARYIEHGMQETGTVNVVTGMILNYRGFDTMGETHVLFIAATTVMILLFITKKSVLGKEYKQDRAFEPKNDAILQKVATFLVPVIAVFGIYVVLNGHLSPGGGFSGGAIMGAGLILYVSAFGFKKTEKFFNEHIYVVAKVSALCCYVCCLSYYFYMGANGFDNHIPLGTPGAIISSGLILFIDIFVGTEVACTMYAFYALFRRGEI